MKKRCHFSLLPHLTPYFSLGNAGPDCEDGSLSFYFAKSWRLFLQVCFYMEEIATHASRFFLEKKQMNLFLTVPDLKKYCMTSQRFFLKNAFFNSKGEHIPEIWCINGYYLINEISKMIQNLEEVCSGLMQTQ